MDPTAIADLSQPISSSVNSSTASTINLPLSSSTTLSSSSSVTIDSDLQSQTNLPILSLSPSLSRKRRRSSDLDNKTSETNTLSSIQHSDNHILSSNSFIVNSTETTESVRNILPIEISEIPINTSIVATEANNTTDNSLEKPAKSKLGVSTIHYINIYFILSYE